MRAWWFTTRCRVRASSSSRGYFKDWERWEDLHKITVKTLTLGGDYDTMDPEDIRRMAELMPNATAAICPNGSHLAMWDDQAVYFEHLLKFLKSL